MVEMNKILTGILFTVIITLGVVLFYTDGIVVYSPVATSNISILNSSMNQRFNDLNVLSNTTATHLQSITNPTSSLLDKVGAFFGSGYDSLKLVAGSFGILNDMVSTSADQLGAGGSFIRTVRVMLPIAILIIIFVGIVLQALIKSDRI
jgi:hypothetical protein